jgi:diguanylate cyclase (GGDEF)-like protein
MAEMIFIFAVPHQEEGFMKKGQRIMVVDDDEVIRIMMKQLIESSGFICEVAKDGKEAIKMASEYLPDLIILDVSMPQMDGFEVCRILRKEEHSQEIPILFLSAKSEHEDRIRGFEMGADDYVPKPFSYDELLARIRVSLRKAERFERERRKAQELEARARYDDATEVFNRKYFETLCREEIKKSKYSHSPLTFIALDIDRLSKLNDEFGFQQGTRAIRQVAHTFKEFIGERGSVSRYEGGFFQALLPTTDLIDAEVLAEELRKLIEDMAVESYPSGFFHLTVSIGLVRWSGRESTEQLFKRAEEAMYRAKKTGKNKVTCG